MNQIKVYAELHWAITRPELYFALNDQSLLPQLDILESKNFSELTTFTLTTEPFQSQNIFTIEMRNKTDDLILDQHDHWVDVVNIEIDQVPADQLLLTNTHFEHSMSESWCNEMKSKGITIQDKYQPGTEIRLNGICFFKFQSPFLFQRIINEWNN